MTDRKAEIEARLAAATPGPWKAGGDYTGPFLDEGDPEPNFWRCWQWSEKLGDVTDLAHVDTVRQADAEFIAHARADIPWLLGRLGELESDNEQLRREIAAQRHDPLRHIKAKHDPDFAIPYTDEEWRALDA